MGAGLVGYVFLGGTGQVGVADVGKPRVVVRDERRSSLFGIGCPCREQGGTGVVSGSGRACFCLLGLDNEGPSHVFLVAFPGEAMPWSLPAPKERFSPWAGLRLWLLCLMVRRPFFTSDVLVTRHLFLMGKTDWFI